MFRVNARTFYAILKDSKSKTILLSGPVERTTFLLQKLRLIGVSAECLPGEVEAEDVESYVRRLESIAIPGRHLIVLLQDDYSSLGVGLQSCGYLPGKDFRWIKRYGAENLETQYRFDPILGFNTVGSERLPGFFILGDEEDASAKRIVILGGSSTDPGSFHFKSWPEFLKDELDRHGYNSVLFNGAVTGYTAAQELVKLLRDVMALRPDIVISLSGINNNHLVKNHPFYIDYNLKLGKYFERHPAPTVNMGSLVSFKAVDFDGDNFDKYRYWLNQEKTMRYFCGLNGVDFYCFLQPNLMSKRSEGLLREEREYLANRSFMGRPGLTPEKYREITSGFRRLLEEEPQEGWLYDLTDIFDGEAKSVYEDGIHVNERGNMLTAKAVFDLVRRAF